MTFNGGFTQAEIGERIGVSQIQVSRILRSTLARLDTIVTAADLAAPGGPPAAPGNDRRGQSSRVHRVRVWVGPGRGGRR